MHALHALHTHLGGRGPSCGQLRQRPQVCSLAVAEARGTRGGRLPLTPPCRCLLLLHLDYASLHGCAARLHISSSSGIGGCTGAGGWLACTAAAGRYAAIAAATAVLCRRALEACQVLHARPHGAIAARLLADDALAIVAVH